MSFFKKGLICACGLSALWVAAAPQYTQKNGILYEDGKAVFGLGQNYYGSYFPNKMPYGPNDDREAVMKKDLQSIKDAGFNIIRIAAQGKIFRNADGSIALDIPFTEKELSYAAGIGLAAQLRLHGYSINTTGEKGRTIQNRDGKEIGANWIVFVQDSVVHPGVIKDNLEVTEALAKHFAKYPAVVTYLVYNEPQYDNDTWDYNPATIEAWKKWSVARGEHSAEELPKLDAPRNRPVPGTSTQDWVSWLLFRTRKMSDFLNLLGVKAHEVSGIEAMTCQTMAPLLPKQSIARGVDYFQTAEKMDVVGVTHYRKYAGDMLDQANAILAMAESAAAVYGKHAWIVEADGSTRQSPQEFERETFACLGAGLKGIIYYQWRADYPYPNCPEPELFGFLWNNGKPTPKFDRAMALCHLIRDNGNYFVNAEKVRSGVALLVSQHALAQFDARHGIPNMATIAMLRAYADLEKAGVPVDFVRPEDLAKNPLHTKLVISTMGDYLSGEEKAMMKAFEKAGGKVWNYFLDGPGYFNTDQPTVLRWGGITPVFAGMPKELHGKLLRANGNSFLTLCLVRRMGLDLNGGKEPPETLLPGGAVVTLQIPDTQNFTKARFLYPGREEKLDVTRNEKGFLQIRLPAITTGGIIVIE